MNNKDIIELKDALVSKLGDIEKALLKMLDFYTEEVKEDTIVEVRTFDSNDLNISTTEQKFNAPVFDGKRMHWFWLHVDNFDSANDIKIGLNGDSDTGITIKAGKSLTIDYDNLKIDFIMYKSTAGTPNGQILLARPTYQGR
jgi:hypothetical protein